MNRYILEQPVVTYRLATFAYPKEAIDYLNLADNIGVQANMIIDSGAFTAWSVGKAVQLEDLIAYNEKLLKAYGDRHRFMFISLDAIPGERGRRATSDEITKAVETSYRNFVELQKHFAPYTVLPVFHSGEDFALRDAYLLLTDYLCLSMDQGMPEHTRLAWAKRAASVPGVRFHGLAATGNNMVTQVNWHSADSSSWITVGAMGGILWPSNGRFRVLPVSNESPNRHDAGKHLRTLSPIELKNVLAFIEKAGYDVEQLETNYTERRKWNVLMWCYPPWKTNPQPALDLFHHA